MIGRPRRDRAPVWFEALVGLALAIAVRVWTPAPADGLHPQLAFWFIFSIIVGLIWKGVQIVGHVTMAALSWSVTALWAFAQSILNGAQQVARGVRSGFFKAWDFTRSLYDDVLKPAWTKFWSLVDRVRASLEHAFRPVLDFLRHVREEILGFYTKWVRPILDTIDVTRKILRVLSALHLDFAKRLDAKLGALEDAIDRPFRLLLAEVNKIINLVDRVVTANGLFQRLALVRSIERDIRYVVNAWHNSQSKPLTDADRRAAKERDTFKSGEQIASESRVYLETGVGPHAASIDEWSTELALRLGRP
jgi:hypothetical protein